MASWWHAALCRGVDPEAFFPSAGESSRDALSLCERCPVREVCLEDALREEDGLAYSNGIRGGLTAKQRRAILRQRRAERRLQKAG